eukprot:CAMPEP_0174386178 /NCGR_PEP_ID=MMETSP0811_2-20130205/127103_1 /TAXON_ID=73025 ORGANISM="Eutreptiella gymnastica-like, Strain CCMP1594" /NCGR_SAMPLE_ID=MMETSP0811_2 /ASSEMBLY_ACC=CAM_ASM_000667 /LENGTH=42 /DNA_ID= /DNA_START= /DNA_END= /DNA_ORIENTATION=
MSNFSAPGDPNAPYQDQYSDGNKFSVLQRWGERFSQPGSGEL